MGQLDTGFSNSFNPIQPGGGPTGGGEYGDGYAPMGGQMGGFGGGVPLAQALDPQMAALNGGGGQGFYGGFNWNPTYQQNSGYNPSQYATQDTANSLAGGLGANVRQTQNAPGSPFGPPPQQMLDFGGSDMLNAGLMAERYKKYPHAQADQQTQDELRLMGPRQAPNEDSQGGTMGSWSQYGNSLGGTQNLGGGQNIGQFIGAGQPNQNTPSGPASGGGFVGHQAGFGPGSPGAAGVGQTAAPNHTPQPGGGPTQAPGSGGQSSYNSQFQDLINALFGGGGGYGGGQRPPQQPPQGVSGGGLGRWDQFSQANTPQYFRQRPSPFGSGNMSGFANSMNSMQNPQQSQQSQYQRPGYSPFGTPQLGSGRQPQPYTPATMPTNGAGTMYGNSPQPYH